MENVGVSELLVLVAMAGFIGIPLAVFFVVTRQRTPPLVRCPGCRKRVSPRAMDCPACGQPL